MSHLATTRSGATSSPRIRAPFLSLEELLAWLELPEQERPLLLDGRGERQYRDGHLPGSINVPARVLNPVEDGVRRLATTEELRQRLGLWAVRDVVVYGGRGGADAAHLRWTLRLHGWQRAFLLDGGIEAWQADGQRLEVGDQGLRSARSSEEPRKGNFATGDSQQGTSWKTGAAPAGLGSGPGESGERLASGEELLGRLNEPDLAVVDTREPEEFSGELMAAKRGGHVPGAILFPWTEALDANLHLRPEEELRELLAQVLAKPEAIVYCQSGVRAAHTLAVLEMLGHPRPRLYLGSWGEWADREDTPVEVEAGS